MTSLNCDFPEGHRSQSRQHAQQDGSQTESLDDSLKTQMRLFPSFLILQISLFGRQLFLDIHLLKLKADLG
jgi:hypothetical protein